MGIKNLNTLFKKYVKNGIQVKKTKCFTNKVLAIDTSIYLYKFAYNNQNYIKKFLHQILKFWENSITPVYIFDGTPPIEKHNTLKKRKMCRDKLKNDINNLENQVSDLNKCRNDKILELGNNNNEKTKQEINELVTQIKLVDGKLKKKTKSFIKITSKDINNCKKLFNLLDIKYIVSNSESDILCANLQRHHSVDCCISDDLDFLTHGCNYLLRNYNYRDDTYTEYNLQIILQELNITYDQFIDICILCGCDYTSKISGIGPINAYKLIQKHNNIEHIIEDLIKDNEKSKYKIKEDFDYVIARNIFKNKKNDCLISVLTKDDFEIHNIDYENLIIFLQENSVKFYPSKIQKYKNMLSYQK